MRSGNITLSNNAERQALIRAVTDYVEVMDDMSTDQAHGIDKLKGRQFDEQIEVIRGMRRVVHEGKSLVGKLKALPDCYPQAIYLDGNSVMTARAGLEMDVECGAEMEPFYRLLGPQPLGNHPSEFTRAQIEVLRDEVFNGVSQLVTMKDLIGKISHL